MAVWDRFLTERDRQVAEAGGFGRRQGFGQRPALLVIDVSYSFCGDRPEPILQSIRRWPYSCGEEAWAGIAAIARLLAAARGKGLPVIYTTGQAPGMRRADGWESQSWSRKMTRATERPRTEATGRDGNDIVDNIAPGPGDILVHKIQSSGFHGTMLAAHLTRLGCDSLLVTGTVTSGCVRSTVEDAFALNYRVAVVEEAVFDRSQAHHAISLFDMQMRCADVVTLADALRHVGMLPDVAPGLSSG
jgi:nicotinamidase-related amidase